MRLRLASRIKRTRRGRNEALLACYLYPSGPCDSGHRLYDFAPSTLRKGIIARVEVGADGQVGFLWRSPHFRRLCGRGMAGSAMVNQKEQFELGHYQIFCTLRRARNVEKRYHQMWMRCQCHARLLMRHPVRSRI